jgi:hypothetical protein
MQTYVLKFAADGRGEPQRVVFEAETAAKALEIARCEAPGRAAELWEDGRKLCTIRRDPIGDADVWQVFD